MEGRILSLHLIKVEVMLISVPQERSAEHEVKEHYRLMITIM